LLRRGSGGSGGLGRSSSIVPDASDNRIDSYCRAFLNQNFVEHAGGRRWDFGIDLVGGYLEKRLVAFYVVTRLLQPASQRTFHNAFAHLGHDHVNHRISCNSLSAITIS
jgi:hypothetical protein